MNLTILKPLFIALSLLLSVSCLAQENLDTDAYIKAYFSLDQEKYAPYLDEKVRWSDPTWSEVDPNNRMVVGKQQMIEHLKKATQGITHMNYDIDHQFQSADLQIYEGTLSYTWTDQSGKAFKFSIREISILKMRDNKIIEHTDYSDFKTWIKQYQKQ